jgi:toxin ParE1/3/4
VKLRYPRKAAAELADILDYIAAKSPQGERSVSLRIQQMVALLAQYPDVGRITSKSGLRRLVVTPYPYLVFYRVTDDAVVIHGIRHSARRPDPTPG